MSENKHLAVRPASPGDLNFIFNSWLKSYYDGSYFCKRIKENVFFRYHHKVIEGILARSTTSVLIASDPEDSGVIWGYAVFERFNDERNVPNTVLHYVYVKESFRTEQVASQLMQAGELDLNTCSFSHWTYPMNVIINKFPNLTYNPYFI
jgi:acetyltransferase (GNAT) family protein